jgi:imidazolonepropionase-like amidohydrolase
MAGIIFANCAVLDGASRERREDQHELVEGDRIREVSERSIRSTAAETVDLAGRTLMPGLIDAHVHVLAVDAALARLADGPAGHIADLAGLPGARRHADARLYNGPRRGGRRWRAC